MIGLNLLAPFVQDRAALFAWLRSARPGAMLVMDDPALAQAIKRDLPDTIVIHRSHHEQDKRWHVVMSPANWLAAYRTTAGNGVLLQVMNEPEIGDLGAFLGWLEELVRICPPDLALALPAFAVGNPLETTIQRGAFDRLLRLVCGTRHVLALHEYFRADAVAEAPYLCGRFRFWLERAKLLGLDAPRIVVTEFGRDQSGGRHDGWRDTGWSEAQYAALLTTAHDRLYLPYRIPVCIFGYGRGANDDWQSFDVEGAGTVLDEVRRYNAMTQLYTDPRTAVVLPVGGLNLRPTPSTEQAAIRKLPNGATITIWQTPVTEADGYQWVKAQWGGDVGFVAVTVAGAATYKIQETEPPVDSENPPIFSVWLTIDELRQDLELELEAARLHQAEGQIAAQMEANAKNRALLLQKAIDRAAK